MNATDLNPVPLADARLTAVVEVLAEVAKHLTVSRPTALLSMNALLVVVRAKALDARGVGRGAGLLADAAVMAAPVPTVDVTCGEFALVLRRLVAAAGYEWSEEDNKPVIREPEPLPRRVPLPGPRKPLDGVR